MQPKKIAAGGQEIAYYESSGSGSPVVLIHGNSASSLTFQAQMAGNLGQSHRVVAIDLPGHGESDRATDPAATYTMPGYAAVIAEVARELAADDGVFVGWSLGGHIVLEAVKLLPRAAGFAIFGTPPLAFPPDMENAFKPNPAMGAAFAEDLAEAEMAGFAAACLAPETSLDLAPFVADIRRTDGRARAVMGASIAPDGYEDEVEVVKHMTRPLAVLHGEHEQLVNDDYIRGLEIPTLWRGDIQMIPGAGHTPQVENPDVFSDLVASFASDSTR